MKDLYRTLLALYLPQLVPLLFGPLRGHAHCQGVFMTLFPVVPGSLFASSLRFRTPFTISEAGGIAIAGAITLALIATSVWLLRRFPRQRIPILACLAIGNTVQALGLAAMIRV